LKWRPKAANVNDIPGCVVPFELLSKLILKVGAVYVVTNLLINFGWVYDTVNSYRDLMFLQMGSVRRRFNALARPVASRSKLITVNVQFCRMRLFFVGRSLVLVSLYPFTIEAFGHQEIDGVPLLL
jgi:hypothetical protein